MCSNQKKQFLKKMKQISSRRKTNCVSQAEPSWAKPSKNWYNHNVHFSNCSMTVRPARHKLGLNRLPNYQLFLCSLLCFRPKLINTDLFFAAYKPLNSAKLSWSKLFFLVLHGGSKYHQLWSIQMFSCHSLPFLDTFYSKIGLIFP